METVKLRFGRTTQTLALPVTVQNLSILFLGQENCQWMYLRDSENVVIFPDKETGRFEGLSIGGEYKVIAKKLSTKKRANKRKESDLENKVDSKKAKKKKEPEEMCTDVAPFPILDLPIELLEYALSSLE